MTQAISVRCQHCGAPLQVANAIRFVTCGYCHSELEIIRDSDTIHTEVLKRIDSRTQQMQGSLKVIEVQNEIERLDREWEMWRERHLPKTRDGFVLEPQPVNDPIPMSTCLRGGLGLGFMAATTAGFLGSNWSVVGILFLGSLAAMIVLHFLSRPTSTQVWYQRAKTKYLARRHVLLSDLAEARRT